MRLTVGDRRTLPVPGRLNLLLAGLCASGMVGVLALASASVSAPALGLWAGAFALLGQPLFSLIHEAEHDKLHPHRGLNDAVGVLLSALFPGSFSILRAAHLAHHRRNRTDAELIDYVRPGEVRLFKTIKYYTLISGALWVGSPLLSMVAAFLPARVFKPAPEQPKDTDLGTFLSFMAGLAPWRLRAELAAVVGLWGGLVSVLDLRPGAVALCYAAFAALWGSQQYVYHVRTPLHVVEGSFDLHMGPLARRWFLNFNYHLTHHREPHVPWVHLPRVAERQPWRPYLRTWARSWLPPRPFAAAWPQQLLTRGPLPPGAPPEFQGP